MAIDIAGYVARIINDRELILNVGHSQGVAVGDQFAVLDQETMDVPDPKTRDILGSLERVKAIVQVAQVAEKLSLAKKTWPRDQGIVSLSHAIAGTSITNKVSLNKEWPEGVVMGDPIKVHKKNT